jgi:hypothetical protein
MTHFNWDLRVPFLYQDTYISLRNLERWLLDSQRQHPAATRRHLALMHARGGKLGVGSAWRKCPHPVSPASSRCESFHQDQEYADGFEGNTAIDYVWIDGPDAGNWHDAVPTGGVPVQGSAEAKVFGIHANVGTPGTSGFESWHGQPTEIDGWGSATGNGSRPAPAIDLNYPLPAAHNPYLETGDDMETMAARRVIDTRGDPGPHYNAYKLKADGTATIEIPEAIGFKTAQVTVTIGETTDEGFLTTWPSGTRPQTSFQNYKKGQFWTPETMFVRLASNGSFKVWSLAGTHLIVDFTGIASR